MTQRVHDINGWFEVKRNPLSKVGIYDYSGAQIGAEDKDRIYRVYRPAAELASPETIDSFKLVPFINDHTMLGDGFKPAEDVGVEGVIGENVVFEDGVLYGNPKVYSKTLAEKIKSGKTELSCGYRCRYDFTPGEWNGQQYDVVQRDIRGNHLALVDEGRMGPEVAILDHLTFAVDAKELLPVDEELKEMLAKILARLDALETAKPAAADEEAEAAAKKAKDEEAAAAEAKAKDEDIVVAEEPAAAEVEEKADEVAELAADLTEIAGELKDATATDAKLKLTKVAAKLKGIAGSIKTKAAMDSKQIATLSGKIAAVEARPAMDERTLVDITARRTSLVERLSKHVGTFDHAAMTTGEIAAYGIKKLEIKGVAKGSEAIALDAYLQAKGDPTSKTTVAQDNAPSALSQRIANHGAA